MERIDYLKQILRAVCDADACGAEDAHGNREQWTPETIWALAEGLWTDAARPDHAAPLTWREAQQISVAWRSWISHCDDGTATAVVWDSLL